MGKKPALRKLRPVPTVFNGIGQKHVEKVEVVVTSIRLLPSRNSPATQNG
jgi:hypothetical protein